MSQSVIPGGVSVLSQLLSDLQAEIRRQDAKHGPYEGTPLGRSRLALATLEDECAEALQAWRDERKAPDWDQTRAEVLQVAAVAIRALRDALPEVPVDRCPDCEQQGRDVRAKLDTRVLRGGRGLYICPECGAKWQNADEPQKFSAKDVRLR